ncbi:DEAD/DEAH box helicase [Franconibacter helveticus]|uniref:DEAD/DEAH box helicase n=1 Tax=Franconibacter helveticus TaxID=357240 RepID=UPI000DA20392|nr:DEAD/DEAH box helicase [Franconibacter helveticus]
MKVGFNSKRLFGITRSKGKMYEFGLDESQHLKVPEGSDPLQLFVMTVATLGDVTGVLAELSNPLTPLPPETQAELNFCASFFDAILDSGFAQGLERTTLLLASAAYYIARRPGSSLVLARRIEYRPESNKVEHFLQWLLKADFRNYWRLDDKGYGSLLNLISHHIVTHFSGGGLQQLIESLLKTLRNKAYKMGTAEELLYADVAISVCRMRLAASAWSTLPQYSGLSAEYWRPVIQRGRFPKELWPSQLLLGTRGIYSGASGLIQMPTSAGKTRSIELVLRSAFMSARTRLAVVVAPFRALCQEIALSLQQDLAGDDIKVNELTDALQIDFVEQIAELLGSAPPSTPNVLVLTPEKFLYVLRQSPKVLKHVGLVVYDEGHQFDTGGRGITYELLLTEIKGLLPDTAQTLLISAVMQNPQAVARWLMGPYKAQVVDGATLLPTSRSVAFASWTESLGQLMFHENGYDKEDYFVPRIIEPAQLEGIKADSALFPTRAKSSDVSLYLGLRVAGKGSVAIFCGTKLIANGIAKRAVEIADAGYTTVWPSAYADPEEVSALKTLIEGNFGSDALLLKAAELGIYTHHSNTPQGIRLALEHGMQKGLINFIACTSTLAQGVNLPIRYLIVQGVNQGAGRVKVRDFQNLIGRAGRAGMHTEGVVIFADSTVWDRRKSWQESWKFQSAVELLSPESAEGVTSSLLLLLKPFTLSRIHVFPFTAGYLLDLMDNETEWQRWAQQLADSVPRLTKNKKDALVKALLVSLTDRKKMTHTLESYLMANCTTTDSATFEQRAGELARETLAYSLASTDEADKLEDYFRLVARRIESVESSPVKQAFFGKTLLGAKQTKRIEIWADEHKDMLLTLNSNDEWLTAVWPLLAELSDSRFFRSVEPDDASFKLALLWIDGTSFGEIFRKALEMQVKKKVGKRKYKVSNDDILQFLESKLAFDCTLILAALAQFIFSPEEIVGERGSSLAHFQKSLKYGLPDTLSMSVFEAGFADRYISQAVRDALLQDEYEGSSFDEARKSHPSAIEYVIRATPAYFKYVLSSE